MTPTLIISLLSSYAVPANVHLADVPEDVAPAPVGPDAPTPVGDHETARRAPDVTGTAIDDRHGAERRGPPPIVGALAAGFGAAAGIAGGIAIVIAAENVSDLGAYSVALLSVPALGVVGAAMCSAIVLVPFYPIDKALAASGLAGVSVIAGGLLGTAAGILVGLVLGMLLGILGESPGSAIFIPLAGAPLGAVIAPPIVAYTEWEQILAE